MQDIDDSVAATAAPQPQAAVEYDQAFTKARDSCHTIRDRLVKCRYNLQTQEDCELLRRDYSSWLYLYEHYLDKLSEYKCSLPDEGISEELAAELETQQGFLLRFKQEIEGVLSQAQRDITDRKEVFVVKAPSVASSSGSLLAKRLSEEQSRAELEVQLRSLREEQAIREAEFKLAQRKEELSLRSKLEAAKARSKVYEQPAFNPLTESTIRVRPNDEIDTVEYDGVNACDIQRPEHRRASASKPDVNASHGSDVSAVNETVIAMTKMLKKPQIEIKKFSGDPIEFNKFRRQFQARVSSVCEDDDERMSYLEQYTEGEAGKVVRGFSHLPARLGFNAATTELSKRYGNAQIIANAYVEKLLSWPVVKIDDAKGLDELAIFLTECMYAISEVSGLGVLEYAGNMKAIVKKLPYQLHDRWRSVVQRVTDGGGLVHFKHLVDFVSVEARKGCDAVYGRAVMKPDSDYKKSQAKSSTTKSSGSSFTAKNTYTKPKSFATTVTDTSVEEKVIERKCLCCENKYHPLDVCRKFNSWKVEDRVKYARANSLCFGCLKKNHMKKDCTRKLVCTHCSKWHPTSLHQDGNQSKDASGGDQPTSGSQMMSSNVTSVCGHMGAGVQATMVIVPVKVRIKNKLAVVETYAFMDPGSSISFCTDSLLRQLGGSGNQMTMSLETMGEPCTISTRIVKGVQICGIGEDTVIDLPEVYTMQSMPVKQSHIPTDDDIHRWQHLHDIHLPQISAEIGLLIGNNVPDVYSPIETKTGPKGTPHATRTAIGWIPWNVLRDESQSEVPTVNRIEVTAITEVKELNHLDRLVQNAINIDFPERVIDDRREASQEDRAFLKKTQESMVLVNSHYQICLPFRDKDVVMPHNRDCADSRLKGLKRKMATDSNYKEEYSAFMTSLLSKGYAEKVPTDVLDRRDGRVWYLPHHGVRHPTKKKLRVVFDCAAKYEGVALNDKLLQGPNLTNNLLGVLMRFREDYVAIMGDIEAMFHQVRVPEEERDVLRFLWWPDGDIHKPVEEFRMCVHLFGATSSPACSSLALRETAKAGIDKYDEDVVNTVLDNFYVDDCLKSLPSDDDAIKMISDVKSLCSQGGFNVTKWLSNSREVNDTIPEGDRAKTIGCLDMKCDVLPVERALGVTWDTGGDVFGFRVKVKDKPPTRRNILSITSSIYDPLGFAAPCTLVPKIILRQLCGREWDEQIDTDSEIYKTWERWQRELPRLENIRIPRCLKSAVGEVVECQLHHFADASDVGYGTVSYLRVVDVDGNVSCSLVMAKSRVAPLKRVTIPRMELTAATLAVKMNKVITDEMRQPIDEVHYWTDSQSVLLYIANEKSRFHTFVANRVGMIREATDKDQWHYVPSKMNPADVASRGGTPDQLQDSSWFTGPEFLSKPKDVWPHVAMDMNITHDDPEIKQAACAVVQSDDIVDNISDYRRLLAVMAWLLIYKRKLRQWAVRRRVLTDYLKLNMPEDKVKHEVDKRVKQEKLSAKKRDMCLSVDDLLDAEEVLIRKEQHRVFESELLRLMSNQSVKVTSPMKKLDPVIIDDLIRVGGRVNKALADDDMKHPIIVPKSRLAELIVRAAHRNYGHLGKNALISNIRQRFWIIGLNSMVKRVISSCVVCRRYTARLMQQKMADLPDVRLQTDVPPFTNTGVDYFGPFVIRRGRSSVKRYGVLFTCLTSRAVHLEVAHSMDTDSCINCIRRFISRRGQVKFIKSDNGSNLISANKELRQEIERINSAKIQSILAQKAIRWEFSPPTGSNFGGVWERLIRSVRKHIYCILREQTVHIDDDGLNTLFCEVESILNSRPLTQMSDDPTDLSALTPNHILLLREPVNCPPGLFSDKDVYVKRRWRQVQYLADIFWSRWLKEYMTSLQERQKWVKPQRNVTVGDIVLLADSTPRGTWVLGRVIETYPDENGLVRIVKVKTATGAFVRPINKLSLILEGDI